jgi:hypothetical protein
MMELNAKENNTMPKPQSHKAPKKTWLNEEEESPKPTPRTETSSNDVNNTPREVGFTQYVHHRERRYRWLSKEEVA